jgi:DNA-binding transcriptional LysR family regulator
MELRHLRYFIVAAEEENFHRAAQRLHIAQSALSRQIKDLEDELDVQLFERNQRRVRLSEAGRMYLEEVRRILADLQQVNRRTQRFAQGELGALRISLHNAVVRYPVVSQTLQAFRVARPDVELTLSQMYSPEQLGALRERQIDAAFVLYIRDQAERELDHIGIGSDQFVLAMPRSHALAQRKRIILEDLRNEPFLWMNRGINPHVYDRLMNACLEGGLSPNIVQHVLSQEVIPNLVSMGMGLGFVLSYTRHRGAKVVFREVQDLKIPLQLDLLWRRDNASATLAQFVDTVARNKARAQQKSPPARNRRPAKSRTS